MMRKVRALIAVGRRFNAPKYLTDAEQATSRSFFLTSFDPIAAISASDKSCIKGTTASSTCLSLTLIARDTSASLTTRYKIQFRLAIRVYWQMPTCQQPPKNRL